MTAWEETGTSMQNIISIRRRGIPCLMFVLFIMSSSFYWTTISVIMPPKSSVLFARLFRLVV